MICQTKQHYGRPATVVFLPATTGLREPLFKCDECAEEMEKHRWVGERIEVEEQPCPEE